MGKKALLVMAAMTFFSASLLAFSLAEGAAIGSRAVFFEVRSGDDKIVNLDMVRGKVVVMFYETKDVILENRNLKNELKRFYEEQTEADKERVVRLPVINCAEASFPFTGIWKSKLRENSKKEGITIYGDWKGKMEADWNMKHGASNVLIIDKKGIVRYFSSGMVEYDGINKTKELLKRLLAED